VSDVELLISQAEVIVSDLSSPISVDVDNTSTIASVEISGEIKVEVSALTVVPSVSDPSSPLTVVVNLAGVQGPQGPAGSGGGSSEEDVAYKKLVDFIDENTFYIGQAQPGTATSAALWRIKKVTIAVDGDVAELWANGSGNFDNIWDNRASLSYS
jgi:hypothetical protein